MRNTFLAALDHWLVWASQEQASDVRAILTAADGHTFRDEVRRCVTEIDSPRLVALAGRSEWADQPSGIVRAFAQIHGLSDAERLDFLRRAVERRPTDFDLLMQLGDLTFRTTSDPKSDPAQWYQAALGLRPRAVAAHAGLGISLRARGDLSGAEASYREAIRLDPKHGILHEQLGRILSEKGDLDGAIMAYQAAIRIDPIAAHMHYQLGRLFFAKADFLRAEAAYRAAIRLDAKAAYAYNGLGMIYELRLDINPG